MGKTYNASFNYRKGSMKNEMRLVIVLLNSGTDEDEYEYYYEDEEEDGAR